jgi:hypothetical protein
MSLLLSEAKIMVYWYHEKWLIVHMAFYLSQSAGFRQGNK